MSDAGPLDHYFESARSEIVAFAAGRATAAFLPYAEVQGNVDLHVWDRYTDRVKTAADKIGITIIPLHQEPNEQEAIKKSRHDYRTRRQYASSAQTVPGPASS